MGLDLHVDQEDLMDLNLLLFQKLLADLCFLKDPVVQLGLEGLGLHLVQGIQQDHLGP